MTVMTTRPMSPDSDRSVRDIIASARSIRKQSIARTGVSGALCVSLLAGLLQWLCFTPVNASPLAWLAPIPLLLLVRIEQRTRWMYAAISFAGVICQLAMLQWMRLGDPTMYIAWVALSIYVAFYSVAFVLISRVAVHRCGIPLTLSAPVVWTGLEYLRAHLLTGFAWYLLGHSQYRWLELIQISDIVGAYGVSFVVVMSAAALTLMVPHAWLIQFRLVLSSTGPTTASGMTLSQLIQVASTLAVFMATLGYGYVRRGQADFQPGPRVALIQGNFTASLREEPVDQVDIYMTHLRMTARAVREQAQIIVWPESMFPWPLLSASEEMSIEKLRQIAPAVKPEVWRDDASRIMLQDESQRSGAALIFGAESAHADEHGVHRHNSAVFVRPHDGLAGRYDKIHLVPFGEYVPLMNTLPALRVFSPYNASGGLEAGKSAAVFEYGDWRIAPVICFEDTVPHLVRQIVATASDFERGKPIDMIVNMTNDGWFHGSSELDQHLITAAFRAVECRTPVARAVNTGISAIIDGDGAILEPEQLLDGDAKKEGREPRTTLRDPKTGDWYKQMNAALIHTVPLDSRGSLYVRYGDWFAMGCAAAMLFISMTKLIPIRTKK